MDTLKRTYGTYGGAFLPEVLVPAAGRIARAFGEARQDPGFCRELRALLREYVGRPTPLGEALNLSRHLGGPRIFLKREDLCHTGSHKLNNVLGQLCLARTMGMRRVIAETGAGQHGVATATGAALFGMECTVYMGARDVERQDLNVRRMELLGARVHPVTSGAQTLKDATNEAIRTWCACAEDTFYVIGSVVGPHPWPSMVAHFQSVIGTEAREQVREQTGALPAAAVACIGGGSNAAGLFGAFLEDPVELHGAEAGGRGLERGTHGAALTRGRPGIFQGMYTKLLQDRWGNILPAHSAAAGLDYPGVGPLHVHLQETGRAHYRAIRDQEAWEAFHLLARTEGIIPALESAHAIALAGQISDRFGPDDCLLVCLSGRGDKDIRRSGEEGGREHD